MPDQSSLYQFHSGLAVVRFCHFLLLKWWNLRISTRQWFWIRLWAAESAWNAC